MRKSKELKRLESIMKLGILDTPMEERFDRLTRLATKTLNAPISTVTIIDTDREWYKSCIGVSERERPRTISFCNHAIQKTRREPFIIEDTYKDRRFKNNPMVVGKPYLRFYAGMPLFDKAGIAIGAFCIKDTKPRKITKHEIDILKELGRMAEEEINVSAVEALIYTKSDWFSLFTDNLNDVFWLATAKPFKILFLSKAYEKLLGESRNILQINPKGWIKRVHPEDRKRVEEEFIKGIKKKKNVYIQHRIVTKNGELRYVQNRSFLVPGKNKESDKILGIINDITEIKKLDIAKTEFLSLASHQLRTPPTIIKWYCDLLKMGEFGQMNDKQREFITKIQEGNKRMINLVNGLLNISRMQMGTFVIKEEKIDLPKIMKETLDDLKAKIEEKNLTIKLIRKEFCKKFISDPVLVSIIFQNLVGNAVNYSKNNGTITIECCEKQCKGTGMINFQVKDNGIGIKKTNQKMIMTRFYRGDNANKNGATGSGLGLYMTKTIIEEMGGKIDFKSQYGKGTTFSVSIPKKPIKKNKS